MSNLFDVRYNDIPVYVHTSLHPNLKDITSWETPQWIMLIQYNLCKLNALVKKFCVGNDRVSYYTVYKNIEIGQREYKFMSDNIVKWITQVSS